MKCSSESGYPQHRTVLSVGIPESVTVRYSSDEGQQSSAAIVLGVWRRKLTLRPIGPIYVVPGQRVFIESVEHDQEFLRYEASVLDCRASEIDVSRPPRETASSPARLST